MHSLAARLRALLGKMFFEYFFRAFLLFLSVGQWACIAWFLSVLGGLDLPGWGHAAGAAGFYLSNRAIVARRRTRPHGPPGILLRVYSAVAFVSGFCFVFLLVSGALWLVARATLAAVTAQALPVTDGAAAGSDIDAAFRWFISAGMSGIVLLFTHGYVLGQRQLRVVTVPLQLSVLGAFQRPLRIIQISDIHVGQNLTRAELERFVGAVNRLDPDLICITGDIADSPFAHLSAFFPILGELRARHGVCAVLGNHDHYAGADHVVEELRRWTSFRVLRDEALNLEIDGARLHVIGLDDRGRDWARGLTSDDVLSDLLERAPAGVPILLLAHRPDIFEQAARAGVALTLSGHTHGGQLAIPWFGGRRRNLAEFITRFHRGLFERDGSFLYVNAGLGVTAQRIRLFTPREISLIELRSGTD